MTDSEKYEPLPKVVVYNPDLEEEARFSDAPRIPLPQILADKKFAIAIVKKEMFDPLLSSYSFDLTSPAPKGVTNDPPSRKLIVKFYIANSRFYMFNSNPANELELNSRMAANYLKRHSSKLYGRLSKTWGDLPEHWDNKVIFNEMRANLPFTVKVEEYSVFAHKKPYEIHDERCADMEFVTDTGPGYINVVNGTLRKGLVLGVIYDEAGEEGRQILGLCRGEVGTSKMIDAFALDTELVDIKKASLDRVRILVDGHGYCKKLCTVFAQSCLQSHVEMVDIHSIQVAAHVCYLKSFLGPASFSHCVLLLTDAFIKVYSLVDHTTIDTWLVGNNKMVDSRDRPDRVRVGANLQLELFNGGAALAKYARTLSFHEKLGHVVDIMEVLCATSMHVDRAVDAFLTYQSAPNTWGISSHQAKRRVFHIKSREEYKQHIDEGLLKEKAEYYEQRAESPLLELPAKDPRPPTTTSPSYSQAIRDYDEDDD
jgi:hypothetical protein